MSYYDEPQTIIHARIASERSGITDLRYTYKKVVTAIVTANPEDLTDDLIQKQIEIIQQIKERKQKISLLEYQLESLNTVVAPQPVVTDLSSNPVVTDLSSNPVVTDLSSNPVTDLSSNPVTDLSSNPVTDLSSNPVTDLSSNPVVTDLSSNPVVTDLSSNPVVTDLSSNEVVL